MSLDALPLELLEIILEHEFFPAGYSGYYLLSLDNFPWSQRDLINLAAVNRKIRSTLTSLLWRDVQFQVKRNFGSRRDSSQLVVLDKLCPSSKKFTNWVIPHNKSMFSYSPRKGNSYYQMFLLSLNFSFLPDFVYKDPCLSSIRSIRVDATESPFFRSKNLQQNYSSIFACMSPKIMPQLRTLEMDFSLLAVSSTAKGLGKAFSEYTHSIEVTLTLQSMMDIGQIEKCGLFPYIHGIVIKRPTEFALETTGKESDYKFSHKIPNLRTFAVQNIYHEWLYCLKKRLFQPDVANIFSECIDLFSVSNLTYLDFGNFAGFPASFSWLPSTVHTLRCNPVYLQAPKNEALEYIRFDNVKNLTLVASSGTPEYGKLYFRNLTTLFIESNSKILFIHELVKLFF